MKEALEKTRQLRHSLQQTGATLPPEFQQLLEQVVKRLAASGHFLDDDTELSAYRQLHADTQGESTLNARSKRYILLGTLLIGLIVFRPLRAPVDQGTVAGGIVGRLSVAGATLPHETVQLVASDVEAHIAQRDLEKLSSPADAWSYLRKRRFSMTEVTSCHTNDKGDFVLDGVSKGAYYLVATSPHTMSPSSWFVSIVVRSSKVSHADLTEANSVGASYSFFHL